MISNSNQISNIQSPFSMFRPQNIFENSQGNLVKSQKSKNRIENEKSGKNNQLKINNESIANEQNDTESRKQQHLCLFLLNLLLSFSISFQNIFLVFSQQEQTKGYMSITIALLTIFFSLLTTYYLCQNKWTIFNLYILLDNIFLTQVASSFGFIGFLMVIYYGYWYQLITMIAFPIQIIFFVGNFRIMMYYVKWSRWRIILFKLVLLADSAAIFQIGSYYMANGFQYTRGRDSQLDSKVKDFVLLYIFGLFALFVELYAKMSDIDQTSQLKYQYSFKEMSENKKIERIRRSMIGMNKQVEQARNNYTKNYKKMSYLQVQEMVSNIK